MQRCHPPSALVVDAHEHGSRQLDGGVAEQVPHRLVLVAGWFDPGDGDHAAAVLDPPGVAHLTATTGVERRPVELDAPWTGPEDLGFVFDEVRSFVAEVDGHGSKLPTRPGQREPRWRLRRTAGHEPHYVFKSASKARRRAAAAIAATSVLALGVGHRQRRQFDVRT